MQAFHRNSRHALPRQFSLDIGQATSTFHRESTRTEDSVALMERAVRTSGNQGPKGQRAKLSSRVVGVVGVVYIVIYLVYIVFFRNKTILGLKTDMEFMIFMTLGSEMQCEQCEIDRSTLQYSAVAVV